MKKKLNYPSYIMKNNVKNYVKNFMIFDLKHIKSILVFNAYVLWKPLQFNMTYFFKFMSSWSLTVKVVTMLAFF